MQNPPRARPAPKAGLVRYPARLDPYMRPVLNLPVQSGSKYAFKAPRLYLITTALRRKLELTLAIFFSHSFVTISGCFHVDSATLFALAPKLAPRFQSQRKDWPGAGVSSLLSLACVAQRETKYALKSSCEERRGSATAGLWQDPAIRMQLLAGFPQTETLRAAFGQPSEENGDPEDYIKRT